MAVQSYRDRVRPSIIDTAVPSNGRASAAQTLANTLRGFQRTASSYLGGFAADQGRREGAEAGRTDHPALRTGVAALTAHGRAYNDAATRAYSIRSEAAADEHAARLEEESPADPERFRAAFGARRDATLKAAPPEARAILAEVYDRRMAQGVSRLTAAQAQQMRQDNLNVLSEGIDRATDRIAQLRASNDPALHGQADDEQVKLDLLIDGARNDGTLNDTEAGALRMESTREVTKRVVGARLRTELDDPYGDPVGFIQSVIDRNKTSNALPPEEEDKLVTALLQDLQQHNALRNAAQNASDDEQKLRWAEGDRAATASMLAGSLTQSRLRQMTEDDEIDPAVARTLNNELQSGADKPDDARERFRVETTLLELEEDEIAKNPRLSWDTRSELVLKRRELLAGWRGTQAAREAADRIDRSLGILPNMPAAALDDDELRRRDAALTEWYNVIDALPPDQRQRELIPKAEEVIKRVVRREAQSDIEFLRGKVSSGRAALAGGDLDEQEQKDLQDNIDRWERSIKELEAKGQ